MVDASAARRLVILEELDHDNHDDEGGAEGASPREHTVCRVEAAEPREPATRRRS